LKLSPYILRVFPGEKIVHDKLNEVYNTLVQGEETARAELTSTLFPTADQFKGSFEIFKEAPFELTTEELSYGNHSTCAKSTGRPMTKKERNSSTKRLC
jgi:hypothetical protein